MPVTAKRHERWGADRGIACHHEGPLIDSLERGRLHDGVRSASSSNLPFVKQDHRVGESRDEVELVADDENGAPAPRERREQLEHRHLVPDIEERGRLVEDERVAALCERPREPGALPFSARKREDVSRRQIGNAGVGHRALDERHIVSRRGAPRTFVRIPPERDVLMNGEREDGAFTLWDDGDSSRELTRIEGINRPCVDLDASASSGE